VVDTLRADGYDAHTLQERLTALPTGLRSLRLLGIAVFIVLLELVLVGAVAGVLGAVLGDVVSALVGAAVGGRQFLGVDMPAGLAWPDPLWTLFILVTPVLTVALGGILPAWRVSRLQPDLALRDQA
jgi:ABC-type antimicrobial peptide transport system permease subunit